MLPSAVEDLKVQYTDKYVKVDAARPELARFRDVVGQVKTVNMSGRALVEFLDYHLNIGWFDIDTSCLTIVDKPAPKVEKEKKPEPKAAVAKPATKAAPAGGEKKPSPLEMARAQGAGGAAKPAAAPAAGKKSVADVLAAARGGAAAPATKAEPKAAPAETTAAAPAKVDRSKMSVAEMLAAARGNKPAGEAAPAAPAPTAKPAAKAAPAPEPPAEEPAPAPAAVPAAAEGGVVKIDRSSMSVADMIAYARKSDAK